MPLAVVEKEGDDCESLGRGDRQQNIRIQSRQEQRQEGKVKTSFRGSEKGGFKEENTAKFDKMRIKKSFNVTYSMLTSCLSNETNKI